MILPPTGEGPPVRTSDGCRFSRGALRAGGVFALLVTAGMSGCSDTTRAPAAPSTVAAGGSFTLSGTIRESLPDGPGPGIAGVRVEIAYKSGPAGSTTADSEGKFCISGLAAKAFRLVAARPGYQPCERDTLALNADTAWDLTLEPIPSTVTGTVTETAPTETTPVSGARVTIMSGANRGRSVITESDGTYALPRVWGDFDVLVSQTNYDAASVRVSLEGVDARVDLRLTPSGRVTSEFTGKVCGEVRDYYSWLKCAVTPLETRHGFVVHRSGIITFDLTYDYVGDYYPNSLGIELRCGGEVILATKGWKLWECPVGFGSGLYTSSAGPLGVPVSRPGSCELRLFDYLPDLKGGRAWTTYRATIDHPR
jgi:hypothetical protein